MTREELRIFTECIFKGLDSVVGLVQTVICNTKINERFDTAGGDLRSGPVTIRGCLPIILRRCGFGELKLSWAGAQSGLMSWALTQMCVQSNIEQVRKRSDAVLMTNTANSSVNYLPI